jgi:type II secretory pathway pseudopilin PulG
MRTLSIAPPRSREQGGFTYLWVLMAIAVIGIGLLAASDMWVTTARREKTQELEWIGSQFIQAIGSYYQSSPGAAKSYPPSLQALLDDRRHAVARRHLRTIYRNPFTGAVDWDLVMAADGTVRGVRAVLSVEVGGPVREFVYLPLTLTGVDPGSLTEIDPANSAWHWGA